jgi:putative ABC transport system permease protein
MNLVTARSAIRAKEISLRKVVGAGRKNIIYQFLGESVLMSSISLVFSLIFVERLLPVFNDLTGKNLSLIAVNSSIGIPILLTITVLTGIIAGSYPAFFLSAFKPGTVLKGSLVSGTSPLRKFLVVFQFSLSVIMIISTMIITNQLNYIKDQNLGFNKDHIIYLPLHQELQSKVRSLKNEMEQYSQIQNVTATSNKIGISQFHSVDLYEWEGNSEEKSILLGLIYTDYEFLTTFDIEMAAGRYYSTNFASDSLAVVVNEAAIREMGLKNPIGKKIFEKSHIIGVVKDFNYQSLHSTIGPLAIGMNPRWIRYLAIKVRPENINETLNYIKSVMTKFAPEFPFDYHFLDQEFEKLYHSERRLGKMFLYFSILAILISALGLFGLASFMARQRTKEIGIRKVLGAPVSGILLLLSKEFTKWVILANLIAWPVAWYVMNYWLKNFAYRTNISWWVFVIAGSIALIIALITVSSQALKVALSNPIDALRYE